MELTLTHDLIDLAILLATDELFVLICKLNLDTHLVRRPFDERYLVDHHHCRLYGVI